MTNVYVLVVDDEPHIRHVVSLKLRAAGIACEQASQGLEALDIVRVRAPALVVTDYQMPGMDGLQLSRALVAESTTARAPVLLLTARGHRVPPSELAGTNIQQVIDKPFSPRQLIETIRELLDAASAAERAA
ncbi:MAG: response regulator [Phycisphaerales bacterium]